jgi:hypothetical protein
MKIEEVFPALRAGKKIRNTKWYFSNETEFAVGEDKNSSCIKYAVGIDNNGVARYYRSDGTEGPFIWHSYLLESMVNDEWEIVENF